MRILVIVGGLVMAATSGIAASLALGRMVDEINRNRPVSPRESRYWWTADKTWRVIGEYRRQFPDGPVWRRLVVAWSFGAFGVVLIGAALFVLY